MIDKIPNYNKIPFNQFKKEAIDVFLEIHFNNNFELFMKSAFMKMPDTQIIENKHGIKYLKTINNLWQVNKETSFGEKLENYILIDELADDTKEIVQEVWQFPIKNGISIEFLESQAIVSVKNIFKALIIDDFIGFCEECFISNNNGFGEFFGESKSSQLITECLIKVEQKLKQKSSDSIYNFINENKNEIENQYFLVNAFKFEADKVGAQYYQKYEKLKEEFLIYLDVPEEIPIISDKVANIAKNWAKNKSLDDVELFDEFYPMDEKYKDLGWFGHNDYDEKVNKFNNQQNKIKKILGLNDDEKYVEKDGFDNIEEETKKNIEERLNPSFELYNFFKTLKNELYINFFDYSGKNHSFFVDEHLRIINGKTEKEDLASFYDLIEAAMISPAILLCSQRLNQKKNNIDTILYGFEFPGNETFYSLQTIDLRSFLDNNQISVKQNEEIYCAHINFSKQKNKPKI